MNRLRALLIAVLLLALPIQGLVAYTPAMACGDMKSMHDEAHGPGQHEAAKTGMDHHHHQNDSAHGEPSGGHACCHHVVSAGAPCLIACIAEMPRVLVSSVPSLATLHIPELPQRPPRA